jgi:hypothetical protein
MELQIHAIPLSSKGKPSSDGFYAMAVTFIAVARE